MSKFIKIAFFGFLSFYMTNNCFAQQSIWNHNNSTMEISVQGSNVKIYYLQPRQGLPTKSGTLLFNGVKQGANISGIAYIFSEKCGPIPYDVSGTISGDQNSFTMFGKAPRRGADCRVASYFDDTLNFNLIQGVSAFNTVEPKPAQPVQATSQPQATPQIVANNQAVEADKPRKDAQIETRDNTTNVGDQWQNLAKNNNLRCVDMQLRQQRTNINALIDSKISPNDPRLANIMYNCNVNTADPKEELNRNWLLLVRLDSQNVQKSMSGDYKFLKFSDETIPLFYDRYDDKTKIMEKIIGLDEKNIKNFLEKEIEKKINNKITIVHSFHEAAILFLPDNYAQNQKYADIIKCTNEQKCKILNKIQISELVSSFNEVKKNLENIKNTVLNPSSNNLKSVAIIKLNYNDDSVPLNICTSTNNDASSKIGLIVNSEVYQWISNETNRNLGDVRSHLRVLNSMEDIYLMSAEQQKKCGFIVDELQNLKIILNAFNRDKRSYYIYPLIMNDEQSISSFATALGFKSKADFHFAQAVDIKLSVEDLEKIKSIGYTSAEQVNFKINEMKKINYSENYSSSNILFEYLEDEKKSSQIGKDILTVRNERKSDEKLKEEKERLEYAKNNPYTLILTCGLAGGSHINIIACLKSTVETEARLNSDIYKIYNFQNLGTNNNNGFAIKLKKGDIFSMQNASDKLILSGQMTDNSTGKVVSAQQASRYGNVIFIGK